MSRQSVNSQLDVFESENVKASVAEDLKKKDPAPEVAQAILKGGANENPTGNDRSSGHQGNRKNN
jgi:hypothetical protein